jgi:hypothetical protein
MTTDEQLAVGREKTRRWRQRNPEKNREVARRAMAKYLATPAGQAAAGRNNANQQGKLRAITEANRPVREEAIRLAREERQRQKTQALEARAVRAAIRHEEALENPWKRSDAGRACRRRYKNKPEAKMRARSNARLNRKGLTQERHDQMLAMSGGNCWACGQPETRVDHQSGRVNPLSIDHDHNCCPGERACGKCVRGLLCDNCNRALGCLNDSLDRLEALRVYLLKGAA